MKIKIVLEPSEEGGFTVYVPSLPGCISEGNTKEEALGNIQEAISLFLEPVEDDLILSPNSEQLEIAIGPRSSVLDTNRSLPPCAGTPG